MSTESPASVPGKEFTLRTSPSVTVNWRPCVLIVAFMGKGGEQIGLSAEIKPFFRLFTGNRALSRLPLSNCLGVCLVDHHLGGIVIDFRIAQMHVLKGSHDDAGDEEVARPFLI